MASRAARVAGSNQRPSYTWSDTSLESCQKSVVARRSSTLWYTNSSALPSSSIPGASYTPATQKRATSNQYTTWAHVLGRGEAVTRHTRTSASVSVCANAAARVSASVRACASGNVFEDAPKARGATCATTCGRACRALGVSVRSQHQEVPTPIGSWQATLANTT
eukprot:6213523-Pleurochrysis_carterae.AAC.4